MQLQGKTVVLGVSGGIAAYKAAALASMLTKAGADVHVILTRNATEFIAPLTFETLTGNRAITDTFDRNFEWNVGHVSLAKRADAFLIAPATANVLAKLAHGLADDMLTTTVLAARCVKIAAPAMNTGMLQNPVTQRNLSILRELGFVLVEPDSGRLACGDDGAGRLPDPEVLFEELCAQIAREKDLAGRRVLVTAAATRESIDPVRYITNHSTGKMGYALARAAMQRGAAVTLVTAKTELTPPPHVEVVRVDSAMQMANAVLSRFGGCDILLKAAAVADYTPLETSLDKIKKKDGDRTLALRRTRDILAECGEKKRPGQILCGFSMETRDLEQNSRDKLARKNADLIVANSLREEGAGFGSDTNIVTLIRPEGAKQLPKMDKLEVAHAVLDEILQIGAAR